MCTDFSAAAIKHNGVKGSFREGSVPKEWTVDS